MINESDVLKMKGLIKTADPSREPSGTLKGADHPFTNDKLDEWL